MINKSRIIFILVSIVSIGTLTQFIFNESHSKNPPVVKEPQWDSPRTKELFSKACIDCHSNETTWPRYSTVFPMSWLIESHVKEGREHFNVSMWGVQKKNKGKDAAEEVSENEMPPFSYKLAHPEARLTDSEKEQLEIGLKKTFK